MVEALGWRGPDRSRDVRRYESGKRPVPERVALRAERLLVAREADAGPRRHRASLID